MRAILYALLVVAMLLSGPLSQPAIAQPGVTIGFAVDSTGLVASSEMGKEVGRYLESRLSFPVKTRSFAGETQLYNWLSFFREVDVAWLSTDFLNEVPEGQMSSLAASSDHSPKPLRGEIVVRPEMNTELCQQLSIAFLTMHEDPSGKLLLSQLGISRFVSPEKEHPFTSAINTEPQTGKSRQQDTSKTGAAASWQKSAPPDFTVAASDLVLQREQSRSTQQVDTSERPPASTRNENTRTSPPSVSPDINQKKPIAMVADSLTYNSEEDSYEAKGDVVIQQGGVELKAGELLWQAATQDVAAQGSVQLNDAGTEVSGERLQYNMSTGQGQVRDGRIFIREGNFHLAGEQIEKHGQAEYFVKQGSFTTCDGDIPDWKFSASEVDVTLGGYAQARNVWFHVKDIPVLYTPYLMFPVKTERESGLLTPSFGYSNNKGALVSLAWYQVIDRNMDATVSLDYLSEVGLGKGLEYRYAMANQNNGEAFYYHVTGTGETPDLKSPEETEDIPDLYYLRWGHRGKLPGNWRLMADIEYTDNKLFFEEFGEVAEDYNRDKTVSTLMLSRNWQKLNLVGHARYIKDLETDNDATLQRLPELSLGLARYRLGDTPFYAGLESYATRFSRNEGEDGERLYLKPSFSAVFTPGSWLEIVPQIALYERLYSVDDRDDEMFVPEFSLGLATRLVKNFDVDSWGMDRLQHSVEPKVTYTYTPDEFQNDLPLFDLHDRIEALNRNAISYALVNRLTARSIASDGSSAYRDILNLRLSQSYDIDEERNNRSGENQPFSPVRVELDFWPTSKISMDLDSRIAVYGDTGLQSLTIGSSASDNIGNAVRVNYSYKDESFAGIATDYVQLQLDSPILKPIYTRFEERYDFRENRELEKVLGLEYRSQCWSLLLSYRNRYREDQEDDQEFMITFILAGLGQDKGFGSRF